MSVNKNILVNFIGKFWSLLSNFLFIPLYIHYLGFESYSVISFTLIVASMFAILDSGLTSTLSREFARGDISVDNKEKKFIAIESLFSLISLFAILISYFSSDYIAKNWVNSETYSVTQIAFLLKIVSIEVGFNLLFRFYLGGLLGLDRQVLSNIIQIGWGVFRNGLVLFVIMYEPTLKTFFFWQAGITMLSMYIARKKLFQKLNLSFKFRFSFDIDIYKDIWKFSLGMFFISIVAAINTQTDKIVISKILSVENLGYYTISVSLSLGLLVLISPIATALLPKFTTLYSTRQNEDASLIFMKYYQVLAIFVFSCMSIMIFMPDTIIWLWTGDKDIAFKSQVFLPVTAFGYGMLALQVLLFNIAIANGYTKLNSILGFISLIITIPGYWYAVKYFGAIGVAWLFALTQFLITIIYVFVINKKFLINISYWDIYLKKLLLPLLLTIGFTWMFSTFLNNHSFNRLISLCYLVLSIFITFILTSLLLIPLKNIKNKLYCK